MRLVRLSIFGGIGPDSLLWLRFRFVTRPLLLMRTPIVSRFMTFDHWESRVLFLQWEPWRQFGPSSASYIAWRALRSPATLPVSVLVFCALACGARRAAVSAIMVRIASLCFLGLDFCEFLRTFGLVVVDCESGKSKSKSSKSKFLGNGAERVLVEFRFAGGGSWFFHCRNPFRLKNL